MPVEPHTVLAMADVTVDAVLDAGGTAVVGGVDLL